MILAVIPARGGSKGIPRKNLQPLCGMPLVVHTIQHARQADLVDRVVVSTDDDGIAAVSAGAGAEVVRRPASLAGDSSPTEGALLHVLQTIESEGGEEPELVVFLQATSPVRRPEDIDGAIGLLRSGGYDSVFSASPHHAFVWEIRGETAVPLTYDPATRPMRQEMGEQVVENGSIYVFRPAILRDSGLRLGGRIGVYRMGFLESLQIDEPGDLDVAAWILERWPGVPGIRSSGNGRKK